MVVDIAGDINKNVFMPNKLIFEPESNNCIPYDIFAPVHKKKTTHEKNEALEQIAYLIMPDRQFTSDSGKFFNDGGRNFLTASLIAFYWQGMSFITICEKIVGTDWRNLCQEIDETGNQLAMQYISAFYGASDQNNAGCKGSCDDAIKLFATNEAVKHALRTPMPGQQSFEPASMEGHNVFFVIEDSKLKLYAPLLHIVTAQCLDYFSTRPNYTGNHILLCLDEFASLGKLEILDALRKYRKKRVRIMVLTQSLADIHLLYGRTETEAMLENCLFKVILGATSKESQVYFSDLIGRKQPFLRSVARHADDAGFAVEPARLANLGRQLILLHPNGYVKLWKNYYFR